MQENNFWSTDRGKATAKMGLWLIFIAILLIIYAVGGNNKESFDNTKQDNNEEVVEYNFKTFDEMQREIRLGNYEYKYEIKSEEIHYIYQGTKCGNQNLGYKESKDGIIKYFIDGDNTHQVLLDSKEYIDNLYENIDTSFLNMDLLFNNLKEYLYNIEKNEGIRVINYKKDGYQVKVTTNLEHITNINIVQELTEYNLEFTKVGECAKISLTEK